MRRVEIRECDDGCWRWSWFEDQDAGWHHSDPFLTYGLALDSVAAWAKLEGLQLELARDIWLYEARPA